MALGKKLNTFIVHIAALKAPLIEITPYLL